MRKLPDWYVTKTLLDCGDGDINKRVLYHKMEPIARFNDAMREWLPEDEAALTKLCAYLNSLNL